MHAHAYVGWRAASLRRSPALPVGMSAHWSWLANDVSVAILHELALSSSLAGAAVCSAWRDVLRASLLWRVHCLAAWPSLGSLPVQDWFQFYLKRCRSLRQSRLKLEAAETRAWLTDTFLLLELRRGSSETGFESISLTLHLADGRTTSYGEESDEVDEMICMDWPVPALALPANPNANCPPTWVQSCQLWRKSTGQFLLLASDGQDDRRPLGQVASDEDYQAGPLHSAVRAGEGTPEGGAIIELLPRTLENDEEAMCPDGIRRGGFERLELRHFQTRDGEIASDNLLDVKLNIQVDFWESDDELHEIPKLRIMMSAHHTAHVTPPADLQGYVALIELAIADWPPLLSALEWV